MILLLSSVLSVATTAADDLWPYQSKEDGVLFLIPYNLARIDNSQAKVNIKVAFKRWNKQTCVKFVPRMDEKNYIYFTSSNVSSSYAGMQGGAQEVKLNEGCQADIGCILHELGHTIGLYHEHTRRDRDDYVKIIPENILDDALNNFKMLDTDPAYVRKGNYDYSSIMHYGPYAFSKKPDTLKTIETLDSDYSNSIGQRVKLTDVDIEKVNLLYSCDCKVENKSIEYTTWVKKECYWWFVPYTCWSQETSVIFRNEKTCSIV